METLRKLVAVILWLISAFLVYAVIHAVASAGGARVGVAIGYIAGAILLSVVGLLLWRRSTGAPADVAPPDPDTGA